jgi:phage shock protein PspC (stress-responsive transcriptional regulator)
MNSQTPTPDDGHPTEPLPERDTTHPTEPLPPASPSPQDQEPARESSSGSTSESGPGSTSGPREDASRGPYAGPYAGPSAGSYSAPNAGSYAYAGVPGRQADFFGWVRSHGISRGQDRWIGGVSSGIAHRMGIDPLIVRGLFIVLTLFAGIGVLLYGLAWAFLPEPDGRIHVQEAGAGRWTSGMTGSLIATILGFSGLGGGFWGWGNHGFGAFLWTIFWVGGAIYLIYYLVQRNKAAAGIPAGAAAAAGTSAYAAGSSTATTPPYSDVAGTGPFTGSPYGGTASGTPSGSGYNGSGYSSGAYGGSGSGGSGWDNGRSGGALPPQGPPPKVRPAGPGAPAVAIIAGSALLVGAGLKALDVTNVINLGDSTNAIAWASAAAVLGLGILLMGLRGRTAGILSFFAVAALIVGGIFNVVGNNGDRMRFQELDWTPVSIEDARNGLDVAGSRGTVDLTRLDANAPLTSDVVVPLDIAASNVTIVIPDKVPVDIKADMAMGNIHESGGNRGGITTRESSYNSDEPGSHLIIQIDGAFSNVTIEEGN